MGEQVPLVSDHAGHDISDLVATRGERSCIPESLLGTRPEVFELNRQVLAHGRMFDDIDETEARSVCVIGTAVRDALFVAPKATGCEIIPLGRQSLLNEQPFMIIGMFERIEREQNPEILQI